VDPHSDPESQSNEIETETQSDTTDLNATSPSVEGDRGEAERMPSGGLQKAIRQGSGGRKE
jgi:hypothetical protein